MPRISRSWMMRKRNWKIWKCRSGWYTDREELPEYTDYGDNADRLRNIGQVFPVIFFLVAALISLTTMTRMVEEQRTQIGTLKALGYKKSAIAAKYICYAFFCNSSWQCAGNADRRENHSIHYYNCLWDYVSQCGKYHFH